MSHVLVTGGTGLLGRHLVPRLLARGHTVHLVVRAGSISRRNGVIAAFGAHGPVTLHIGDVTEPGLGIDPAELPPLDAVFHCAARYDLDADDDDLHAANVDGTAHLLDLLDAIGFAGVLHHVSSIAVAGDAAGTFGEQDLDVGQGFPHAYHRTKHAAEVAVRASAHKWRIYRPAAIVGDSRTGEMDRHDGPYILFSAIKTTRDAVPNWLSIPVPFDTPINMVPVDHVAEALDALAHAPGLDGRCFHLVDPEPPALEETWNLLAHAAGAPRMKRGLGHRLRSFAPGLDTLFTGSPSIRFLRARAAERMGIPMAFSTVHNSALRYEATATRAVLDGLGVVCPGQHTYLTALYDYWLRHLDPDRDPEVRARKRFAGRTVLITGASSGVGRALALRVASLGADVILVARRVEALHEVARACEAHGVAAAVYPLDLNDYDAIDALIAEVIATHGAPDVLVNNAARSIRRPAAESLERFHDFERVMRLNYFAPIRMMRGLLPAMADRGSGHVVNVLTAGVALATPGFAAYASSKAALSHLTDTLTAEYLHHGVHFSGVHLPWVRTPMMGDRFGDTRAMTPEDAAEWIVEGVVHNKQHVKDASTTRRWVLTAVAPSAITSALSVLIRVYDDAETFPEFRTDRALLGRFVKGNVI